MESKRIPEKPLQKIGNKILLERTYDAACSFQQKPHPEGNNVIIITNSEKVEDFCAKRDGFPYIFTGPAENGTHRCSLVTNELYKPDVIVNWQVDYPFVKYKDIQDGIILCRKTRKIVTFYYRSDGNNDDRNNSDCVKLVGADLNAWYFSRSLIPHGVINPLIHVGIYIFPVEFLIKYKQFKALSIYSQIGMVEKLEQLDFFYMNEKIKILEIPQTLAINDKLDLEKAREMVKENV